MLNEATMLDKNWALFDRKNDELLQGLKGALDVDDTIRGLYLCSEGLFVATLDDNLHVGLGRKSCTRLGDLHYCISC
jgi:ATP/maltotriose-dependent transcriptional regulator MalT